MPTYTYNDASGTDLDRVRFLTGDHRGLTSDNSDNSWLFSDNEMNDCLTISKEGGTTTDVVKAALIALQCRANREALGCGVAGTTDTSYRPASILNALKSTQTMRYGTHNAQPISTLTPIANLDDSNTTDQTTLTEF